ncbi:MAG: hypothetical protein AAFR96_06235 [Planctomycetota bacterium]
MQLRSVAAAFLVSWFASGACAHPQDGPHADIRVTISDQDVRLNVGLNLPFLDAAVPTVRESSAVVDPAEEAAVLDAVRAMIVTDTPILINGERVEPVIERLTIERLSDESLYLFPNTGRPALTRFAVVAAFPAAVPPQEVEITWSHYPPSGLSAAFEDVGDSPPPMIVEVQLRAEGRVRVLQFSETERTQTWTAGGDTPETAIDLLPDVEFDPGLTVRTASVFIGVAGGAGVLVLAVRRRLLAAGCFALVVVVGSLLTRGVAVRSIGGTEPDPRDLERMFAVLHSNVYRAFDFTAEDDIYDTLAFSVTGDLLDSLYRQIRRGLVQAENGGGIGKVTSLELNRADVLGSDPEARSANFEVYAEWIVEGTVYHFGHSHAKRTPYAGLFRVSQSDVGWRIDQAEPRPQQPLLQMPSDL